MRGCFFNPYLLSLTALILYHISGSKSIGKMHKLLAINLCNLHRSRKSCRGGRSRHGEKKTRKAQEEALRGTYALESGWLYATHQTIPTMLYVARVDGRGLWRATLRPDIEHKPSEWGRVVVVRPFATNRGWLLAVAKLDGVSDYPNCRRRFCGLPTVSAPLGE